MMLFVTMPLATLMDHPNILTSWATRVIHDNNECQDGTNNALISMSVFQLMSVMSMQPIQVAMVPTVAHVIVVTPVTVVAALTMVNVRSEQTNAMLTYLAPTIRVDLFVLVMQGGKVLKMSALR